MAAHTAVNPRLWKGEMETQKCLIKNGSTWAAGNFLHLDTSGLLVVCASDHKAASGGQIMYALTDQADPGNSTTLVKVGIVTHEQQFLMNEVDTTASSASIGQEVALTLTGSASTGVHTIDISDGATNPFGQVVEVLSNVEPIENAAADTLARVVIKVLTTVIEATPVA